MHVPVLPARGEFDDIATQVDLLNFYKQLPGAAHALALRINRQQFWHVVRAFLEMPPRQDNLKNG